ncbi:MAG: L,D-transpeptidase [bacterium]
MANTFEQHGVPNYDADTHLNNPENKEANKPSASPTHHAEFSGTAPSADEVKNISRRKFVSGFAAAALAAITIGPSAAKAQQPYKEEPEPSHENPTPAPEDLKPHPKKQPIIPEEKPEPRPDSPDDRLKVQEEIKDNLLSNIGIERSDVKPEFLKKYFEGLYEAIVVININDKVQSLYAYSENGGLLIKDAEICSGRQGMETPKGSFESGETYEDYVNQNKVRMPYSVAVDGKGTFIHSGSLAGYPASHGCIRTNKDTAKAIFEMAGGEQEKNHEKKTKTLLIVIVDKPKS